MNYTKPEVAVLGQAVRVIENTHTKGQVLGTDSVFPLVKRQLIPAYDLD